MYVSLTNKQITVLKNLLKHSPMVASYSHTDLSMLLNAGFVERTTAWQASGRLSSNLIWTISEKGRRFLEEERAGR